MEEKEIWKDIEGFEGLYQISSMGRVRSLGNGKSNNSNYSKERILKAMKDRGGYLHVQLWKDGKAKWYLVHRLVAEVFLDNPKGYNEVNHINEDKSDNRADNLEFCSRSYNINYGTRNQKISKPVIAIDKRTGLIVEFPSAMEAERCTSIYHGSIIKCCQGKLNSCGGFYWMFVNNNDDDTE